ncbi:MAG: hypothetical protein U9N34_06045, partial [Candidatus Cloacimonadota bacterium]|nr:hypothetical protein [Candidatus Cloacimonadota bacterium]
MLGNKKQRNYNSERLKAIVKMGEVIPAKIVGRPNSQTFLLFVKGEKVLAQSILEFESNQIIVKVTQKFPKLI